MRPWTWAHSCLWGRCKGILYTIHLKWWYKSVTFQLRYSFTDPLIESWRAMKQLKDLFYCPQLSISVKCLMQVWTLHLLNPETGQWGVILEFITPVTPELNTAKKLRNSADVVYAHLLCGSCSHKQKEANTQNFDLSLAALIYKYKCFGQIQVS